LLAPDGSILKWFGTCTDIDDQKRTEQLLRQRVEELEREFQLLEAKVAFRTTKLEQQLQQIRQQLAALS